MKIGDKVYIPKGNAGQGCWGTISDIIEHENSSSMVFFKEYTEGVSEDEIKVRPKFSLEELEIMVFEVSQNWIKSNQRFGQYFYNQYDNSGIPFPELFYTPAITKAIDLIYENYLKIVVS
ncbi:hypothetical protein KC669_05170 [Candidatus Dojkabacteria bacterium]|uniref:Uncharacterized protein n=1 Tax=Candidatus Dojkabacteria bacterium TaxID=2099670 RepID=A0A955LAZ0_9BACT|nr:hypothetical protein [Candidatus Dojkabacteria bacterium]